MKVVVLGAGVIGVTTAWYLAKAGHEVVVLERQDGAALETSFANAGEISPGYASPWASPGVPRKAPKWLLARHAPLIVQPSLDPALLSWLLAMLRNCTTERYLANKARMVRLAEHSRDCLIALRRETGIQYDQRSRGTLQVFRTQAQMDEAGKDMEVLRDLGVPYELLDRLGCIAREPGLGHARDRIVGGLRLPNDETGDCFKFTTALADLCRGRGVDFRFGTTIQGLETAGGEVVGVRTPGGTVTGDAYVVCLGSYSEPFLRPHGIRTGVYPVKGYSLTATVTDEAKAPVSTLLDETYKVAITRLGNRVRIGGLAELAGYDLSLRPSRRATLEHSAGSLFGGSCDLPSATFWCGLRPMTPTSTPRIGEAPLRRLFLNTGHGTLGWTMACGSAQVLADAVGRQAPALDLTDYAVPGSPAAEPLRRAA